MASKSAHLKRLAELTETLRQARTDREAEIGAAFKADVSIRQITEATGLSSSAVSKILDRTGVRRRIPQAELDRLRRGE